VHFDSPLYWASPCTVSAVLGNRVLSGLDNDIFLGLIFATRTAGGPYISRGCNLEYILPYWLALGVATSGCQIKVAETRRFSFAHRFSITSGPLSFIIDNNDVVVRV
jgi:hypothetical protein